MSKDHGMFLKDFNKTEIISETNFTKQTFRAIITRMGAQKKIRTADIAREAGVSPATVSRVLNHPMQVTEQTRQQVERAMSALGFVAKPAPQRTERTKNIILVNCPLGFNPFHDEVVGGASTSAVAHGFHMLLNYDNISDASIVDFIHLLKRSNASGLITIGFVREDLLEQLNRVVPVVQCCEFNSASDLPYVSVDDYAASQQAVRYLIGAGRTKIAFVNGPMKFKYARERLRGYQDAMAEAALTVPAGWMMEIPDINYDMAYSTVSQLFISPAHPNAFFAASDVLAAAIINAVRHHGLRVPEDVMVIGFDNISVCMMTRPTITTVNQPKTQLGYTACELLIEAILNPGTQPKSALLQTELILRESTAGSSY